MLKNEFILPDLNASSIALPAPVQQAEPECIADHAMDGIPVFDMEKTAALTKDPGFPVMFNAEPKVYMATPNPLAQVFVNLCVDGGATFIFGFFHDVNSLLVSWRSSRNIFYISFHCRTHRGRSCPVWVRLGQSRPDTTKRPMR